MPKDTSLQVFWHFVPIHVKKKRDTNLGSMQPSLVSVAVNNELGKQGDVVSANFFSLDPDLRSEGCTGVKSCAG